MNVLAFLLISLTAVLRFNEITAAPVGLKNNSKLPQIGEGVVLKNHQVASPVGQGVVSINRGINITTPRIGKGVVLGAEAYNTTIPYPPTTTTKPGSTITTPTTLLDGGKFIALLFKDDGTGVQVVSNKIYFSFFHH